MNHRECYWRIILLLAYVGLSHIYNCIINVSKRWTNAGYRQCTVIPLTPLAGTGTEISLALIGGSWGLCWHVASGPSETWNTIQLVHPQNHTLEWLLAANSSEKGLFCQWSKPENTRKLKHRAKLILPTDLFSWKTFKNQSCSVSFTQIIWHQD